MLCLLSNRIGDYFSVRLIFDGLWSVHQGAVLTVPVKDSQVAYEPGAREHGMGVLPAICRLAGSAVMAWRLPHLDKHGRGVRPDVLAGTYDHAVRRESLVAAIP